MAEFAEPLLEQRREEDAGLFYLTRRQSPARPCARDGIGVVSFDALGQLLAFLGNDLFDVVVAVAMFTLAPGHLATIDDADNFVLVVHENLLLQTTGETAGRVNVWVDCCGSLSFSWILLLGEQETRDRAFHVFPDR